MALLKYFYVTLALVINFISYESERTRSLTAKY